MNVRLEMHDKLALIGMDDGKKNALDVDALDALHAMLDQAEQEADAIVLAGRPGSFCAGFDITTMTGDDEAAKRALGQGGGRLAYRLYASPKPIVAACTGHAFTIGVLWLLASDTRIGEAGAYKFGMTETALNAYLSPWCVALLKERINPTDYVPIVAQSKLYDPEGAARTGMLDTLVGEGQAIDVALEEAHALSKLPREMYGRNKLSGRGGVLETMKQDLGI